MTTKLIDGKEYVFCACRKRFVRLTPEEYVRQFILDRLVNDCQYPSGLIAVEQTLPQLEKRADAVVYNPLLHPIMLLEFKRETVTLTQHTVDQVLGYNQQCKVPYLVLSNGKNTFIFHVVGDDVRGLKKIPLWSELSPYMTY